jgi:hypothetical protein
MSAISVVGRINEVGELELEKLPALRPGKVQVTISELIDAELPWEERPWTPEEIQELMKSKPKTGAEIAAMILSGEVDTSLWAEDTVNEPSSQWGKQLVALLNELDTSEWQAKDIDDPVAWVKEQRRQKREHFS